MLLFPLTRLLLALLIIAVAFIARDVVANALLGLPRDAVAARGVVTVLVVWLTYALYVWFIERRPVWELDLRHAPAELGLGMAMGAGMIGLIVFILWLAGAYQMLPHPRGGARDVDGSHALSRHVRRPAPGQ